MMKLLKRIELFLAACVIGFTGISYAINVISAQRYSPNVEVSSAQSAEKTTTAGLTQNLVSIELLTQPTPTVAYSTTVLHKTQTNIDPADANHNASIPQLVVLVDANLRAGPGTNFERIGNTRAAHRYRIMGRNQDGRWLQICCAGGGPSWIYAGLTRVETDMEVPVITSLPISQESFVTPAPPTSAPDTVLPVVVPQQQIWVSVDANLRSGPGIEYDVVGGARARRALTLKGRTHQGDWLLVCCENEQDVWIFATLTVNVLSHTSPQIHPTPAINRSPSHTCDYVSDSNHLQLSGVRVEQLPPGKEGTWVIGGQRFVATSRTSLEQESHLFFPDVRVHRSLFNTGIRVDVEYCHENGVNYAWEIEIQ